MHAIILAGGKGTRLKPLTTSLPKPLVPIGDMPILEVVIRQLKFYGFTKITMAVNHLAELIMAFFGNGSKYGVEIYYSIEDTPLGTAGPLSLVENIDENFLVMNGDLLTTINFKNFFDFHVNNANDISIATFDKKIKIDLGVLEIEDDEFINYIEKPTYSFFVSMGVYVINKNIIKLVKNNSYLDLPDLVLLSKERNKKIKCYKGDYEWLDIGRLDDYEVAVKLFEENKDKYLK